MKISMIAVAAFLQIFKLVFTLRITSQTVSSPEDFIITRDIMQEKITDSEVTFPSGSFIETEGSMSSEESTNATNVKKRQIIHQRHNEFPRSSYHTWTQIMENWKHLPNRTYEIHKLKQQNTVKRIPIHHVDVKQDLNISTDVPKVKSVSHEMLNPDSFHQLDLNFGMKNITAVKYNLKKNLFPTENIRRINVLKNKQPFQEYHSEGKVTPEQKIIRSENKLKPTPRNSVNSLSTTLTPELLYYRWLESKTGKALKSINSNNASVNTSLNIDVSHYLDGFNNSLLDFNEYLVNNGTITNPENLQIHLDSDSLTTGSNISSSNDNTDLNSRIRKEDGIEIFFFADFDPTGPARQRKEVMNFDINGKFSDRSESLRKVSLVIIGLVGITAFALVITCISLTFSKRKMDKKIEDMSDKSSKSLVGVKETVGLIVLAIRFFLRNREAIYIPKGKGNQSEPRKKTCNYQKRILVESNNRTEHRKNKHSSNKMAFQVENLSTSPKEVVPLIPTTSTDSCQQALYFSTNLREKRLVKATASEDTIYTTQSVGLSFERKFVMHRSKKKSGINNQPINESLDFYSNYQHETQPSSSQTSYENTGICSPKCQKSISEQPAECSKTQESKSVNLP